MQATNTITTPTTTSSTTTMPATKRTRNNMNRKQNKNKRCKAAPNKRATQAASVTDDRDDDICLICCEPIKTYAVGSCNHRNLCAVCCLRRRTLYNQSDCCLCKQQLDQVVFTFDRSSPFSSFNLGLLASLPNAPGVLFDDAAIRQDITKLFSLSCQICEDQSFTSIFALREHLKKHQLHYCSLCLSHKKVFFNEQILYTRGDLKAHLTGKKGGVGPQNGEKEAEHQFCHFCKKRFFDKDHLYNHLMEKHEKCHLCEKDGSPNQYFDDYNALERHFEKDHFLCKDAGCLEKKFVVFATALALQAHDIAAHVATRKMSKSEKREASKLDIGLVFSTSSSSSSPAPRPAEPPNPPISTAAHRNTNDPLVNFAEHQQMSESWNFPSLPGSGSEGRSCSKPRPVVLGRNEWHKNGPATKKPSSRDDWPTLPPAVNAAPRRVSPPSPPPEVPGYGGRYGYGGREYRNRRPQAATCWGK